MAMRKFNPTSPARRFMTVSTFEELSKVAPEKSLLEPLRSIPEETHTVELPFVTEAAETELNTE